MKNRNMQKYFKTMPLGMSNLFYVGTLGDNIGAVRMKSSWAEAEA